MNSVTLIGNIGSDAELRYTPNQFPIINMQMATSKKDKNSESGWTSSWHKIVIMGELAERMSQRLKKGSKVFVNGELQSREWKDKEGNRKQSVEIVAREVHLIQKLKAPGQAEHEVMEDIPF